MYIFLYNNTSLQAKIRRARSCLARLLGIFSTNVYCCHQYGAGMSHMAAHSSGPMDSWSIVMT